MRVNRDVRSLLVKCESVRFALEQIVDEFFEKKTALRDFFGVRQSQFAIIFGKHRVTRRFEKKDRRIRAVFA